MGHRRQGPSNAQCEAHSRPLAKLLPNISQEGGDLGKASFGAYTSHTQLPPFQRTVYSIMWQLQSSINSKTYSPRMQQTHTTPCPNYQIRFVRPITPFASITSRWRPSNTKETAFRIPGQRSAYRWHLKPYLYIRPTAGISLPPIHVTKDKMYA